jgi:hypothetical protein
MFLDPRGEATSAWSQFLRPHPEIDERVAVLAGMDTSISDTMMRQARQDGEEFRREQAHSPGAELGGEG